MLGVTDHGTIAGVEAAPEVRAKLSLPVTKGVELSAKDCCIYRARLATCTEEIRHLAGMCYQCLVGGCTEGSASLLQVVLSRKAGEAPDPPLFA